MTNSVIHAQPKPARTIDLQVLLLPDRLRIEVTDNGPDFNPLRVRPDPNKPAPGGWGLWLVDQLADRWA